MLRKRQDLSFKPAAYIKKARPDGLLLRFQLWGGRGVDPWGPLDNLSYSVAQAVDPVSKMKVLISAFRNQRQAGLDKS